MNRTVEKKLAVLEKWQDELRTSFDLLFAKGFRFSGTTKTIRAPWPPIRASRECENAIAAFLEADWGLEGIVLYGDEWGPQCGMPEVL